MFIFGPPADKRDNKIWKFESDILKILPMWSHSWKFWWPIIKYKGTKHFERGLVCQVWERHETWWRHLTLLPFIYYDEEQGWTVQRHISNIGVGILSFMCMADYPFKMNEWFCNEASFLWQLQHFMKMRCLSNMVAMAMVTRLLLKITANLIDNIIQCITNELTLFEWQ